MLLWALSPPQPPGPHNPVRVPHVRTSARGPKTMGEARDSFFRRGKTHLSRLRVRVTTQSGTISKAPFHFYLAKHLWRKGTASTVPKTALLLTALAAGVRFSSAEFLCAQAKSCSVRAHPLNVCMLPFVYADQKKQKSRLADYATRLSLNIELC
jgi:hypothetical protein